MKLATEQLQVFESWIRKKIEHHHCALCQSNRWKVGELVVPHSSDILDDITPTGPMMIQLICQNCANVLLFDAHQITHWDEHQSGSRSAIM